MKQEYIYYGFSFLIMGILFIISMVYEPLNSLVWVAIVGTIILILMVQHSKTESTKEISKQFVLNTEKFINENFIHVSKDLFSDTKTSYIVFDHENNNIHILRHTNNPVTLPYSLIVESELNENGDTVMKTNRTSQVTGAIIGGVIASGAGAIIGGLSGKKTSSEMVKDLEIRIVSNDLSQPVITFPIKESNLELEKKSDAYRSLYNSAYEIQKIISLIIKKEENAI